MNIIVDTSVWSLVLRRKQVNELHPAVKRFRHCIESGDGVFLLGTILQELLDGVTPKNFDRLIELLKPFPLVPLERKNYFLASTLRNTCRAKGIQATPVDFLITAASLETGYPLLTTDKDFSYIARHCDLTLLPF